MKTNMNNYIRDTFSRLSGTPRTAWACLAVPLRAGRRRVLLALFAGLGLLPGHPRIGSASWRSKWASSPSHTFLSQPLKLTLIPLLLHALTSQAALTVTNIAPGCVSQP